MNTKLGFVALALAALALVARDSYKGGTVSIDPHELAYIVQHELDHVTPFELGQSIMAGQSKYRVLDLRDTSEYAAYHIPGAVDVSLTELMDARYDRNQAFVIYSEGGVHSAQAMFLLWAKGYKRVYMLKGGLREWQDEILHPELPVVAASRAESDSVRLLRRMTAYFGGIPRSQAPDANLPKVPEREKLRDEC